MVAAQVHEAARGVAGPDQVAVQEPVEISRVVMLLQLQLGLEGEAERPGHIGGRLMGEDPADNVALGHGGS